jgi:hypothetical protein
MTGVRGCLPVVVSVVRTSALPAPSTPSADDAGEMP